MKHGSFFTGIGGFDLAAEMAGIENVFQVENEEFGPKIGMKLQPAFVEWMMGYPLGWTDLNLPKRNIEKKD